MKKIDLIDDEIISIEEFGIDNTIDITVEGTHMFFANDIYTHNSGIDAELVEAHQSGGSIKRIQKAHFFMSVAKTPDQKEASLANVRIIKARFAQDGQTFKDCVFNNNTMQIIIDDPRYKYGNKLKGSKHHDTEDIDKLENKLNKITTTDIHVAINNRQETLLDMINNESINISDVFDKPNHDFDNEVDSKIIDNNIIEISNEKIFEMDISGDINNGVIDVLNDTVNEPVIKIIDVGEWTGETIGLISTNVVEVKIEDIENVLPVVINPHKIDSNVTYISQPIIKIKQLEINNFDFDDPDSIGNDATHNLLLKKRENQNVMKKE